MINEDIVEGREQLFKMPEPKTKSALTRSTRRALERRMMPRHDCTTDSTS